MFTFDEKENSPRLLQLNQNEKQCIGALLAASKQKEEEKQQNYASYFEALGDIFQQRGELLSDTRQQLKAIAIYNLVLASQLPQSQSDKLYEDNLILFSSLNEAQKQIIEKIKSIEDKLILSFDGQMFNQTVVQYWEKIERSKKILMKIRLRAAKEIKIDVEEPEFNEEEIQGTYEHIAVGLKEELIKNFIHECFNVLSPPESCIYSIVALGSLARNEATPFSDFEFAILIQDQGIEKNKVHKEYFRRLTYLLWIKILNLRETTTRMMDINFLDWLSNEEKLDYDGKIRNLKWLDENVSPIKKGFSFDGQMEGGCHTPLGNRHHIYDKLRKIESEKSLDELKKNKQLSEVKANEYELICTPTELAQFHTDEWFKRKHALTTVLSSISPIIHNDQVLDKSLEQEYEKEVSKILDEPIELSGKTRIQRRSLILLTESTEKFGFRGGKLDREGLYFDAKYNLYRLPNMIIDHLAAYFRISEKSIWNRVEAIFGNQGKIPHEEVKYLKEAIYIILTLRLVNYLKVGYRNDIINFESLHYDPNVNRLGNVLNIDLNLLLQIYSSILPFQKTIEKFCAKNSKDIILTKGDYHDNRPFVKGWVFSCLLDYQNAEIAYKEALRIEELLHRGRVNSCVASILNNLGVTYEKQGRLKEALDFYQEVRQTRIAIHGYHHYSVAEATENLGNVYSAQDNYHTAIKLYEESISIFSMIFGRNHISIATTLNNLGQVYLIQGNHNKALTLFKEARHIIIAIFGKMHPKLISPLISFGLLYDELGSYHKSTEKYKKALRIVVSSYGSEHPWVATILIGLGNVYLSCSCLKEAAMAYEEAKHINMRIYGNNHSSVANTLLGLGNVYFKQGHYHQAITIYEEAKKIFIVVYGDKHTSVAETLNSMGNVYSRQNRYEDAVAAYEEALKINIDSKGNNHSSVAKTLNNLGNIYLRKRRYQNAAEAFKKAKQILISLYNHTHPLVATALNNLGNIYEKQGNFKEAITAYQNAKQINMEVKGKNSHEVAINLHNIGSIFLRENKYSEAINAFQEVIRIRRILYDEDHPLIAETLNSLGAVYGGQGNYNDALAAFEEAKKIFIAVHSKKHLSVAYALNNIGNIYEQRGEHINAAFAYEKSKQIKEMLLSKDDPEVADTLRRLGGTYTSLKRYREAIAAYEEAKRVYLEAYDKDSALVGKCHYCLGSIYEIQSCYTRSIAAYEEARRIYQIVYGKDDNLVADIMHNLGVVYGHQGNYEQAIAAYEEARRIYLLVYGENHTALADTLNNLGGIYVEMKSFELAHRFIQQAINIYKSSDSSSEKIARRTQEYAYISQGNSLILQGKIELAFDFYQKANITMNPSQPKTHQVLATRFYKANLLSAVYQHYKILTIILQERMCSNYHNLGCFTHIYAQIEKDKGSEAAYLSYLNKANGYFEQAMELEEHTGICTEYAQFMLKNRESYSLDKIIKYLLRAIELNQQDKELSYGMIERPTVDAALQELIEKEKEISLKAHLFAHYLLIQAYILNHQFSEAKEIFNSFFTEVRRYKEIYEKKKVELLTQTLAEDSEEILLLKTEAKEQQFISILLEISQETIHILKDIETMLDYEGKKYKRTERENYLVDISDGHRFLMSEGKMISFNDFLDKHFSSSQTKLENNQIQEVRQIVNTLQKEAQQFEYGHEKRRLILALEIFPKEIQQILQRIVETEDEEIQYLNEKIYFLENEIEQKEKQILSKSTNILSHNPQAVIERKKEQSTIVSNPPNILIEPPVNSSRKDAISAPHTRSLTSTNLFSSFWQSNPRLSREALYVENQVKAWLLEKIPNNLRLGTAVSKGDCFFDAVAQGLNQLSGKEEYDIKSLRLLCDEYVKDPRNSWMKEANIRDREDHEQYLVRIQFTAQEIEEKERQGIKLGIAIWGRPKIEGRMFCEKLNIKLHIVEIQEDGSIHRFLVDKEGEREEVNPQVNYNDPKMVHLVNYHNHYVPLLQGIQLASQLQEETNLSVSSKPQVILKKELRSSVHTNLFGTQSPYCQMTPASVGKIFRFFDAATLKSAKRVNKQWYKVVQEIEEENVINRPN